ncbi:MAG: alpha/beta hydrolase [Planctomycetaceae bacterium]|nr:alpha/beta hydrolase [Planctomycetaceae bacterium]
MKSPWRLLTSVVLVALFTMADRPAVAQESVERVLTTADNWQIHITYYQGSGGKESPVVILVPGVEGNEDSKTRKIWDGVASVLNKKGYAVVTADLRKHGDSVPVVDEGVKDRLMKLSQNDYRAMVAYDLEAIKTFLVAEHQKEKLNIRKLGIAAAGSSCLVVSAFAVNDWMKKPWPDAPTLALRTPKGQDVRAVMMLSPRTQVKGMNYNTILRGLADPSKGIAINLYYNPTDRTEKRSADSIERIISIRNSDDEDARKVIEGPPEKKYSAENFLTDKAKTVMEKNISEFFDKYVKQREDPWKTRTSKLQ